MRMVLAFVVLAAVVFQFAMCAGVGHAALPSFPGPGVPAEQMKQFADQVDADVRTLSPEDQKIVEQIRTTIIGADETMLTTLKMMHIADTIVDEGHRRFWREAIVMAAMFRTHSGCKERSASMLLYGSQQFIAIDRTCVAQKRTTCQSFDKQAAALNDAAQIYNAVRGGRAYTCEREQ